MDNQSETSPLNTFEKINSEWDPETAAAEYWLKNNELTIQLQNLMVEIQDLQQQPSPSPEALRRLAALEAEQSNLQQEQISAAANYSGDWTLLLQERLRDPLTKQKFITQRMKALPTLKDGEPSQFDKPETFKSHYQQQIDHYDENVAQAFLYTNTGPAASFGAIPSQLGTHSAATESQGAVFSDAIKDERPLTLRQKNIIEAHEKGHGLRDFRSPIDRAEIKSVIDTTVLQSLLAEKQAKGQRMKHEYLDHPDEIIERMAQFKNYFGMNAQETFTSAHLAYIREHYVADTNLDNNVTDFLRCVTKETEPAFLKIINSYPI